MYPKLFLIAILPFLSIGASTAERGVPLLMWKSLGPLAVTTDISKSCTPTNEEFKVKVLEALDEVDNIVLFVQDTLGVEDFSKYGKAAFTYLSAVFDGDAKNHLYLPRVVEAADACQETLSRTRKVSEINEVADGLRILSILKSSSRNLIIIRLKTAGAPRLDSLIEKDERIKKFVDAIAEKDNFVAILTGEKPAVIDMKRPKRQAAKNVQLRAPCAYISAKGLTVELGSKSEVADETTKIEIALDQPVNAEEAECDGNAARSVPFDIPVPQDSGISSLKLTFNFKVDGSSWKLEKLVADYVAGEEPPKKEELRIPQPINREVGKSYTAHNAITFSSKDKKFSVAFDNININPFAESDPPARAKIRATADSPSGNVYFSIPILSALTVSLLFIIIMTWALENITSIKTMDQFDDPRGKTITVPVTD